MSKQHRNKEQWVEFIAHRELPALTSTARLLQKFSNDDVSSLPRLSQAILHDQGLSSCLLKVANSVSRIGVAPVTTVSRATVVLGIQTVKNICLTSKVIDSLIKNKDLDEKVYDRIKRAMASSFYAGQLAKMMTPDYSEDTREEVYLAAMLHRIGETAFWCLGSELDCPLEELAALPKNEFQLQCQELIGMSFSQLTLGLAKQWNLGNLLIKSLDNPQNRTVEIQIIDLADKLASFIDSPPTEEEFNDVFNQISSLMNVNERQLKARIDRTREVSIKLLNSYGAQILNEHINELPKLGDFKSSDEQQSTPIKNKDIAQLEALQFLTNLTITSHDINEFLEYTLKSTANILNFDACSFYLLTSDKQEIKSRFSFDQAGNSKDTKLTINVGRAATLFKQLLTHKQTLLLNDIKASESKKFITPEVLSILENGKAAFAPVMIDNNVIGVVLAHKFNANRDIADDDFSRFRFFIQHLNMCLSIISKRK